MTVGAPWTVIGKMTGVRWTLAGLVLILGSWSTPASAQEGADQGEEHEHHARNEILAFVGNTSKGVANSLTFGLDYERRLGERFGTGVFLDWAANHHEREFIAGVPVVYRPGLGDLKLQVGAGAELEEEVASEARSGDADSEGHDSSSHWLFLVRLGVHYGLELGPVALVPQVNWDITQANDALVIGLAAGVSF